MLYKNTSFDHSFLFTETFDQSVPRVWKQFLTWPRWNDSTSGVSFLCLFPSMSEYLITRTCCLGCTLSKDKPEVKWLANKDNESGEVDVLNQLALGQVYD